MKTILLVEDSRFLRLMNQRALTRAGYSVSTASDGEEAVRLACEQIPDLILLDMLLPKLGGPQVLRALRKSTSTARIPIVVLSSLPQSNESRLKKEGATAYFDKANLGVHQGSDSLIQIVRTILGEESQAVSASATLVEGDLTQPIKGDA
jgi:CheY-like chemotaxis protein